MSTTDLTLVLTAHNENIVSGPTVRSADIAVEAAREQGFSVQKVIALDAATPETTRYFRQPRFASWEVWEMGEGDLGRVRNALVPDLDGRFIAFLDADDLFSENWLSDGVARLVAAEEAGERIIVHPELNVMFDGGAFVLQVPDQDSPLFTPYFFYVRNYYDSLCLTPREAHLDVPYSPRDIPNGLSFQDWQFAVETMTAGWKHVIVRDTIIFKRRRDFSLVRESSNRQSILRVMPSLAIDQVRQLGVPVTTRPS